MIHANAGVAHPVERHLAKVEVASSSLVTRSRKETAFVQRTKAVSFQLSVPSVREAMLRIVRLSKNYSFVIARPRRGRGNLAESFSILYVFRQIRNFFIRLPHRFAPRNDMSGTFSTRWGGDMSPPVKELPSAYQSVHPYHLPHPRTALICHLFSTILLHAFQSKLKLLHLTESDSCDRLSQIPR